MHSMNSTSRWLQLSMYQYYDVTMYVLLLASSSMHSHVADGRKKTSTLVCNRINFELFAHVQDDDGCKY